MKQPTSTEAVLGSRSVSLSLDINPRELVSIWAHVASRREATARPALDAIYIPTRGRRAYLSQVLPDLQACGSPIFLLPTSAADVPSGTHSGSLLAMHDPGFLRALRALRCPADSVFGVRESEWDLPIKRTYALWHARRHGFGRILLLDDDIRGLDASRIEAGAAALSVWEVAGYFVEDFPDTSVLGHVELAVGEPLWPFLSGSCLFVRIDERTGFFPPIYNEDWIFMAPVIARRQVCALGTVQQVPIDPFARFDLAAFQAPGEIIADGLFALLAAGRYEDRFEVGVWETVLSEHCTWLGVLAGRATDPRHRSAVSVALARCNEIDAASCAGFISSWEEDRLQWNRTLKELT